MVVEREVSGALCGALRLFSSNIGLIGSAFVAQGPLKLLNLA
jgi:hypothetical protein